MPNQWKPVIEAAVDNFHDALAAQNAGATSIQLCAALSAGGITPYASLIKKVCSNIKIPVNILVRPRTGDYLYNETEFEMMKEDILLARKCGAEGVVFGVVKPDGSIDRKRCETLCSFAGTMTKGFSRAFDMTADPFFAMEEIIAIGFNYILTSGQHQTAEDGLENIRELVKRSLKRIALVASGDVNENNCILLHEAGIDAFQVHAQIAVESQMQFKNEQFMESLSELPISEYALQELDKQKILTMIQLLRGMGKR